MNQGKNEMVNIDYRDSNQYKNRIIWIELLRILACFFVVLWHVSANQVQNISNGAAIWYVFIFFNTMARCSVPIFVMISGLLYLDKSKSISIRKLYLKNITNLLIIYFFWSIFYSVFDMIINSNYHVDGIIIIKECIKNAIINPKYHLWYLPAFMGLLVVTPIFKELFCGERSKKVCEYTIIVLFIFKVLKTTILMFDLPKIEYVKNILNIINLDIFGGEWIFYYVLGYYVFTYKINKKYNKKIYILSFLAFLISMCLTIYVSSKTGKMITKFYKNNGIFIVLYSTGVFLFFKNVVSQIKLSEKLKNIILQISSCTLGIYLIHPLFTDILFKRIKINLLAFNPIITVLSYTLIIFILSFLSIYILKKIKFANKFI